MGKLMDLDKILEKTKPTVIDINSIIEEDNILRCKVKAKCEICQQFNLTSVDSLYRKQLKNKPHLCYECGFRNKSLLTKTKKHSKDKWNDPLYREMVSSGNKVDRLIKKIEQRKICSRCAVISRGFVGNCIHYK